MSVTVLPLTTTPVTPRPTVSTVTVYAVMAGCEVSSRGSLYVSVSMSPSTAADEIAGAWFWLVLVLDPPKRES